MTIVALSAAYGAAGRQIGPGLARCLQVPFIDRGIALAVAERLDITVAGALAHEEPSGKGLLERLLSGFLGADPGAPAPLPADTVTPEDFHRASQEALLAQAATGHGVILGRGAVAGLRRDPRVLRVRDLDRETAARTVAALDRTHADYLRQFYDVDILDPGLYHLMIDATAFDPEVCIDLIAAAAQALG